MKSYDPITDTKICGCCVVKKPGTDFNHRRNHGVDPYTGYCRECSKAKYSEWHDKNKQRKLEYLRQKRLRNLDKYRQYDADRWRKPEVKERHKQIVAQNRDRYKAYSHNHRVKRDARGKFTGEDVKKLKRLQKGQCAACKKKLDRFHIDHIQPIAKGGLNVPDNLQLLCPHCNISKGATDPVVFMQRRGFLL